MPKEKQTLFTSVAAKYFSLVNRMGVSFKRGLVGKRGYTCKQFPELVASFGCEGDKDAPIAYIDGCYRLRDRGDRFVTFGVRDITSKIKWYNKEGWLPCFVSEFSKDGNDYKVENFADKVSVDGKDFEIVYSRLTVRNNSASALDFPKVSPLLVPLNSHAESVRTGETVTADYAVGADRFGGKYPYPSRERIAALGSFDEHYESMKSYWVKRIEPLCEIAKLPDERLINAYKAGYVYTMIVKDGDELHVGENGYDRVFDHDVIGILVTLMTMGDFSRIREYAEFIMKNPQYPDARWKYSWVFAVWLFKTGDKSFAREKFAMIKENARRIGKDIDPASGIMKKTNAIDSLGSWTIDNWSALMGLCCYEYICNSLGENEEANWAAETYSKLLESANSFVGRTIKEKNLDYLPIAMDESNEEGKRSDPHDANWASMLLFGRWGWDGYLFCADQSGIMAQLIDKTYEHGFERRKDITDTIYNFGGYPHGYYCSAYNAGYGSTALRGDKYRDCAIKAYQFMIEHAMSGPFSWWEGVDYPSERSPWDIPHAAGGGGSCQHIWGQSTATKALLDSLICQRVSGEVLLGRGVPREWLADGNEIEVRRYPINGGGRMGFSMKVTGSVIDIVLTGDRPCGEVLLELPCEGFEVRKEEKFNDGNAC